MKERYPLGFLYTHDLSHCVTKATTLHWLCGALFSHLVSITLCIEHVQRQSSYGCMRILFIAKISFIYLIPIIHVYHVLVTYSNAFSYPPVKNQLRHTHTHLLKIAKNSPQVRQIKIFQDCPHWYEYITDVKYFANFRTVCEEIVPNIPILYTSKIKSNMTNLSASENNRYFEVLHICISSSHV